MKAFVQKFDEQWGRREYPIADRVPGWFFRISEQSAGVYRVDGVDLWGRLVNDVGTDENRLLESCAAAATEINRQLAAKPQ